MLVRRKFAARVETARAARFVLALGTVLGLGGIPGARLRFAPDTVAPPVPLDVTDRDGALEVVVRDAASGHPLTFAHVRALAMIDDRAYLADSHDTDTGGVTQLRGLPLGELWILAEAPGYARRSTRLWLDAVALVKRDPVFLDLAQGHAFDVVVRDDTGSAVGGVEIEALSNGEPLPIGARTDDSGIARLSRLNAGPWHFVARAAGYQEVSGRAERDGEVVSVTVQKLGALLVHCVGPGDREPAGARVAVAGATLWPARASETNANGDVRIAGLGAGTYALRATWGENVSPTELGIALARGEEKSVVLRLAPGRMVGVLVSDGASDDADPVTGARVTLVEGGISPFPLEATTDAKGHARLGPIAAGAATLGARADGFVPRGAVPVSESSAAQMRIALVRSGMLKGRVVDAHGDPIDGATVEIVGTDASGGPIFDDPRRSRFALAQFDAMLTGPAPLSANGELGVVPGPVPGIPAAFLPPAPVGVAGAPGIRSFSGAEGWVSHSDGTFRATPASPGRVRAIVTHPEYVEAESGIVTLLSGGEAYVEVVMQRGGVLAGRVLDTRDRPVSGARIVISATKGTMARTTRTAGDGTFALAALPGAVSLTASADDDGASAVRMEIEIPEGGRKDITVHLHEAREPLPVSVVDARGSPVDAAQVSASSLSADAPLRVTAFTDANGDALIRGALGLPLRVEVRAPARAPRVVTTDGSTDALRVELAAAESAWGEVIAARSGEPIAGAEVTLYTDIEARHTRTDARGGFTLTDLAHGPARLRARAAGFAPATLSFAIPETGGRQPYALGPVSLTAEGIVQGDVTDGHGAPIVGARVAKDQVPTWLLVGSNPSEVAVSDSKGRFTLRELPEGTITLEAYSPDFGRARAGAVRVVADRTSETVHIVISGNDEPPSAANEPAGAASVAMTLGETGAPTEIVIVSVVEGSEAERAGIAPGDVLLSVDDSPVTTIEQARAKLSGPIANDVLLRVRRGSSTLLLRVSREATRR